MTTTQSQDPLASSCGLELVCRFLDDAAARNTQLLDSGSVQDTEITRYHARTVPDISVSGYIDRIVRFAKPSPSVFVCALVLVDRLLSRLPRRFLLSYYNAHRIVGVCSLLAVKVTEDLHYSNKYFAKVLGLSLEELNLLEIETIETLEWRVSVKQEEFDHMSSLLLQWDSRNSAQTQNPRRSNKRTPTASTGASATRRGKTEIDATVVVVARSDVEMESSTTACDRSSQRSCSSSCSSSGSTVEESSSVIRPTPTSASTTTTTSTTSTTTTAIVPEKSQASTPSTNVRGDLHCPPSSSVSPLKLSDHKNQDQEQQQQQQQQAIVTVDHDMFHRSVCKSLFEEMDVC